MKYRNKLFSLKKPYSIDERADSLFLKAVRENCLFHYNWCADYRKILDGLGFGKNEILSEKPLDEYLEKLPFIPTLLLKRKRMYSMPKSRMAVKATSSGTSGSFSEIGFDYRLVAVRLENGNKNRQRARCFFACSLPVYRNGLQASPKQPHCGDKNRIRRYAVYSVCEPKIYSELQERKILSRF